jgi:hypothetical protein
MQKRFYLLQYPAPVRAFEAPEADIDAFLQDPKTEEPLTSIKVTEESDLDTLSKNTLVGVYNALAKQSLVKFRDKAEAAQRTWRAIEEHATPLSSWKKVREASEKPAAPASKPEKPAKPAAHAPSVQAHEPQKAAKAIRRGGRIGAVAALLSRPSGATLPEIIAAYGEDGMTEKKAQSFLLVSWIQKERGYTITEVSPGRFKIVEEVIWQGEAEA